MSASLLFVVRRCDGFHRCWYDVSDAVPIVEAEAIYDQLTQNGAQSAAPDAAEYYEIFAAASPPDWQDGPAPLVRRLRQQDTPAIEAHVLGLCPDDRNLRYFRTANDPQICAYVQGIDWDHSLLLGAISADRVVGVAEALFNRSGPPRHAEIAVSVDAALRGRGLGGFLVSHTVDRARSLGVSQASLSFLRENRPIQRIIRTLGGRVDMEDLVGEIAIVGMVGADTAL